MLLEHHHRSPTSSQSVVKCLQCNFNHRTIRLLQRDTLQMEASGKGEIQINSLINFEHTSIYIIHLSSSTILINMNSWKKLGHCYSWYKGCLWITKIFKFYKFYFTIQLLSYIQETNVPMPLKQLLPSSKAHLTPKRQT